jgi:hypothetical protein
MMHKQRSVVRPRLDTAAVLGLARAQLVAARCERTAHGARRTAHLLSQKASNLTEVDSAAFCSTDSHQRHAVVGKGLGLAAWNAGLDDLTCQRVHYACIGVNLWGHCYLAWYFAVTARKALVLWI